MTRKEDKILDALKRSYVETFGCHIPPDDIDEIIQWSNDIYRLLRGSDSMKAFVSICLASCRLDIINMNKKTIESSEFEDNFMEKLKDIQEEAND